MKKNSCIRTEALKNNVKIRKSNNYNLHEICTKMHFLYEVGKNAHLCGIFEFERTLYEFRAVVIY